MPSSPTATERRPKRTASPRPILLRLYRAAVFIGVVLAIHFSANRLAPTGDAAPDEAELIAQIFYPNAASISARDPAKGAHLVADANGNALGYFVLTSPEADDIIGYSGPTNTMLAFGADGRVLGVEVLSSGDTDEHLAEVVAHPSFLRQFEGKSWEELGALDSVDAVSGATLTSSAIAEGILRRIDGKSPSLRFPKALGVEEAIAFFPSAASLDGSAVLDGEGIMRGHLIRTSPHADNLIGYRGPSDVLIALEADNETVRGISLRETYDTPEYVAYLDERFLSLYDGKTLAEVAGSGEVEGISGATMTSQTIAGAVRLAAQRILAARNSTPDTSTKAGAHDFGTAAIIVFALIMAFTKLRGNRRVRIAFQIVLIVYLGLINGGLLSQALFAGWAQNGVAWQLAPGLVLLAAAALLVPLIANRNLYCHQICPHGAAQQLLKNVTRKRIAVPARAAAVLRAVPFALLLFVIVAAVQRITFNLAGIEPFDAYLLGAAGIATIVVAIVGIVASLFVPMAYCRYGCPTGALLTFLWGNGRPDKFGRRDGLALLCLALAIALALT